MKNNKNKLIRVAKEECKPKTEDCNNKTEDERLKQFSESVKKSDKKSVKSALIYKEKLLPSKFVNKDEIYYDTKTINEKGEIVVLLHKIKLDSPYTMQNKLLYKNVTKYISNTAKDIIFYISEHIEWNVNSIMFDYDDFYKEYPCSKTSFYKGIEELIKYNVIERYYNRRKVYGVNYKYISFGSTYAFLANYLERFTEELVVKDGCVAIPNDIYNMYLNAIKNSKKKIENKNENKENNIKEDISNAVKININNTITEEQLKEMEEMLY